MRSITTSRLVLDMAAAHRAFIFRSIFLMTGMHALHMIIGIWDSGIHDFAR